jgi:hypothetical protein
MINIPIKSGDPNFSVQATLENVTYTLAFRWNVRASAWFMDVLAADGVTIIQSGIKLVCNWWLAAYTTARQPPGAFMALDTSGASVDPGLDELGDRVKLIYFTTTDLGL